jgi:hypothetical protein
MLRSLLAVLIAVSCLSTTAFAGNNRKDGPFPMREAIGTWYGKDQQFSIVIEAGKFYPDNNKIEVSITLYQNGEFFARGRTLHSIKKSVLGLVAWDIHGNYFSMFFSAVPEANQAANRAV